MTAVLKCFREQILRLISKPQPEDQNHQKLKAIYDKALKTLLETLKQEIRAVEKESYIFELSANQINLTEAYLACMKNRLINFNELIQYSSAYTESYKRLQQLSKTKSLP